jgi:hypothetical protein
MKTQKAGSRSPDFSTTITVNATASEAFDAINDVSGWWATTAEGSSRKLNDEFTVRFADKHFSRQKIVELVPGKRVVWLVIDSNLSFLEDKHEWTNTKISFDITGEGNATQINFSHVGLLPEVECYGSCSTAWSHLVGSSLFKLISHGKGHPGKLA